MAAAAAAAGNDPETTQKQTEEIEALSAIYGDEWCTVDEDEKIFCIKIGDCSAQPKWTLNLQVMLPPEYPTSAPPIYQLKAPWILQKEYAELANHLEEIYVQNLGESILYLWVEKIREVLIEKSQSSESGPDNKKITEETDVDYEEEFALEYQPPPDCTAIMLNFDLSEKKDEELPPIYHGNPITDRRSTFQAHSAPVVCLKQILNAHNVLVVVSRWYGGILLGPDRFKHINNCARNILVEQNYTKLSQNSSKHLGKNKRMRKDKKKAEH